ncbi:MAG TPA: right-handed parallel beta-helix repeat-containing protein, partial [Puia sp.]|nr:right-handed parallel beta-helix repeat-containing protein [Puia sp.]
MKSPIILLFAILINAALFAREIHVALSGNNSNNGTAAAPFRTISKAASVAMPGDIIIVHAGVYREMVQPPRGGTAENKRITYMAAPGEKVEIKGSEIVKGWVRIKEDLWKVQLPYSFFGKYNPFTDKIWGDWYEGWLHTGDVYLNEKPLSEDSVQKVFLNIPAMIRHGEPKEMMEAHYTWSCRSDSGRTTIFARFGDYDPNNEMVEVNVRPACFYPKENNINYITVKGFLMSMAATQWAAPTAEQQGLIGTNWSKGWIIEDNVISNSRCTGITLGKDRSTGDNMWSKDWSIDGSVHYNDLVHRVIANGWNKSTIGSHIVRNNIIFNCGQAGICGSFGGAFSEIYGNNIYNVYTYRPFGGAEMAGIKLHAAIDVQIHDNYIHNANLGVWLDWMAQGT